MTSSIPGLYDSAIYWGLYSDNYCSVANNLLAQTYIVTEPVLSETYTATHVVLTQKPVQPQISYSQRPCTVPNFSCSNICE